MKIAVFVSKQA